MKYPFRRSLSSPYQLCGVSRVRGAAEKPERSVGLETMHPLFLQGHSRPLTWVQINNDGDLIFTCGKVGQKPRGAPEGRASHRPPERPAKSWGRKRLAVALSTWPAVWTPASLRPLLLGVFGTLLHGREDWVSPLDCARGGWMLCVFAQDSNLSLWRTSDGQRIGASPTARVICRVEMASIDDLQRRLSWIDREG